MEDGSKLTLDTRLEVGQSSDLIVVNDNLEMSVAVISKGKQQTITGQDTIKTFKVNIYDKFTGEAEEGHHFHEQEVAIGKTVGLIRTFPFNAAHLFPHQNWSFDQPVELDIKAEEANDIIPDYLDYFPFEEGDKLHILSTTTTGPPDKSEKKENSLF
ncbi:MAG: hypothetical protein EA411_03915 [Saprospirales bacterium]|nr:MAG: hypothetical protein EA411_03915 [Saprospirales bacterium]